MTKIIGSDIYEECFIKKLDATVSCQNKAGSGVYDLKITAELEYNFTEEMSTNENGLTKVNYNGIGGVRGDYISDIIVNV